MFLTMLPWTTSVNHAEGKWTAEAESMLKQTGLKQANLLQWDVHNRLYITLSHQRIDLPY